MVAVGSAFAWSSRWMVCCLAVLSVMGAAPLEDEKLPRDLVNTPLRIQVIGATFGGAGVGQSCAATDAVRVQCEGRPRCTVVAANTMCAASDTPASVLIPALTVRYRCKVGSKIRVVTAEQPLSATLSCGR